MILSHTWQASVIIDPRMILSMKLVSQEALFLNMQELNTPIRLRVLHIKMSWHRITAVASPWNPAFRKTWHRLARRVFFTIPEFEELKVSITGCEPLVWNNVQQASQARFEEESKDWGSVSIYSWQHMRKAVPRWFWIPEELRLPRT